MVMRRVEQWPLALSSFLRDRKDMEFKWGVNDCIMMPADLIKLITVEQFDPAEAWRGQYSTEEQARDLVESMGGLDEIISDALGFRGTRSILTGNRGDVVTIKTTHGIMGGVIDDSGRRVAIPNSNLNTIVRLPLESAWRVWSY